MWYSIGYNKFVRCLTSVSGLKFLLSYMLESRQQGEWIEIFDRTYESLTYKVSGLKFVIGNKIQ